MAAGGTSGAIVWEWLDEYGRWRPYDPTLSVFIERSNGQGRYAYLGNADSNFTCYVVDLQNMVQIRQGTGRFHFVTFGNSELAQHLCQIVVLPL